MTYLVQNSLGQIKEWGTGNYFGLTVVDSYIVIPILKSEWLDVNSVNSANDFSKSDQEYYIKKKMAGIADSDTVFLRSKNCDKEYGYMLRDIVGDSFYNSKDNVDCIVYNQNNGEYCMGKIKLVDVLKDCLILGVVSKLVNSKISRNIPKKSGINISFRCYHPCIVFKKNKWYYKLISMHQNINNRYIPLFDVLGGF